MQNVADSLGGVAINVIIFNIVSGGGSWISLLLLCFG